MANCTFFGHRDCPETIKPSLREVLVDLITNHGVNMFYVGNQGQFDAYVHRELKKLKKEYPHLKTSFVPHDAKYIDSKKIAVILGVKAAQNDILVFTDADCEPTSKKWLENATIVKEIVVPNKLVNIVIKG